MTLKRRIPLLKDHHTHPSGFATLRGCLDISSITDKQRALSLIKKQKEEIVVVTGWNDSLYSFTKKELDTLMPLLICNVSFHKFIMNQGSKDKLYNSYKHIVSKIEDQSFTEKNLFLILQFMVNIKPLSSDLLKSFYDIILEQGIWYAEEMMLPDQATIKKFDQAGFLNTRTLLWADLTTFYSLDRGDQTKVYGIKIFSDGALGSRGAAMKKPFLSGENGILVYSDKELKKILDDISNIKKPVAIHAIGDKAISQAINILDTIKQTGGHLPPIIRMEHCQFMSKDNAKKAKSLGIILSMQPNFSYDSIQYIDRISENYCRQNNPFRMLIDKVGFIPGNDLIFGSDGIPHGIDYALTMSLFPPLPDQKLTLDEFIAGYCMENMENGFIDINIDEGKRSISYKVYKN